MKVSLATLLASLPRPATAKWPEGEPFATAIEHGTMSLEVFAPRGEDKQEPHSQDELYFVAIGSAIFLHAGERLRVTSVATVAVRYAIPTPTASARIVSAGTITSAAISRGTTR